MKTPFECWYLFSRESTSGATRMIHVKNILEINEYEWHLTRPPAENFIWMIFV